MTPLELDHPSRDLAGGYRGPRCLGDESCGVFSIFVVVVVRAAGVEESDAINSRCRISLEDKIACRREIDTPKRLSPLPFILRSSRVRRLRV